MAFPPSEYPYADGEGGGTPILAADLNSVVEEIQSKVDSPASIADGEIPVWDADTSSWVRSTAHQAKVGADGILIGGDVSLYRAAADTLKTDDSFRAVLDINAQVDGAARVLIGDLGSSTPGIRLGSSQDVNLYRAAANTLKTDDSLHVVGDLTVDGTLSASGLGATVVTALPGSPTNGQEVILVDSTTTPTYAWHLKYVSSVEDGATDYRWVFIGGTPIRSRNTGASSTTSTSYVDPTNNASITLPVAGLYLINAECQIEKTSGTDTDVRVGLMIAGSDDGQTEYAPYHQTTVFTSKYALLDYVPAALAASAVVKFRHRTNNGSATCTIRRPSLSITPIRVA